MNCLTPKINGERPLDTLEVSFMGTEVRKLLRRVNGQKLSAREITEKLGRDPGPLMQPSGAMMNVIRILAQLKERGDVIVEYPNAARPEMSYWIEPERCKACGTYIHEHGRPLCNV